MLTTNTDTLLTLIESADADGKIIFVAPANDPVRTKHEAREYLAAMFMDLPTANLQLDTVKSSISKIDLELRTVDGKTELSVNLAKVLMLPATCPARELSEFAEFMRELMSFFKAHETLRCDVQVCNHRDRNRRVYGTISCRVPVGDIKMAPDEAANARIKARVDASPVLQYWLKKVALILGNIGPYSWHCFRDTELFGYGASPHSLWRKTQPRVSKSQPQEPLIELNVD